VGAFPPVLLRVAKRYDGHTPGFPFVRFYSIMERAQPGPVFSRASSSEDERRPRLYAELFRPGTGGVKAGSPTPLVAIGETSPPGRQAHAGFQDSTARPVRRAVAQPRPAVKSMRGRTIRTCRSAPRRSRRSATETSRCPNLDLFETNLRTHFHRRSVPIWIRSDAHETKPDEPKGVTYATGGLRESSR